jgi:hypothetical protein
MELDTGVPLRRLPLGVAKQHLHPDCQSDGEVGKSSVAMSTKARTFGVR